VIDLAATIQSTALTFASCCRNRLGFVEARRNRIYTHRVARETQSYTPFRYAQMLTLVGESPVVAPMTLKALAGEHERCDHLLRSLGVDPRRPIVVIHPKTGKLKETDAVRCWPEERFAELSARLTRHYGHQVCLIGSPDEMEGLERIRRAAGEKSRIAPFVAPVNVLLALFEKGKVLISNEGGPTHLAATTRIPIVTVFGPTPESRWRPFRDRDILLLRGAQCAPACLKAAGPCAGKKRAVCVENDSLDQVLQAVDPYVA
jgi:ADP-heptose:LPS heptosyltransferase